MWIENVSMADIIKGNHFLDKGKTILIQIQDFGTWQFANPRFKERFSAIHQFKFDDIEEDSVAAIQPHHADEIFEIMKEALDNKKSIVVHCHAGLCRSSAVAEVGVVMGFQDTEKMRIPNLRVKHMLLERFIKEMK